MASLTERALTLYLALGATAFVASALLTRVMIRVNIPDLPNHRSSHTAATPKSGGLAIATVLCSALLAIVVLGGDGGANRNDWLVFSVIAALVAVLFLFDDILDFSAKRKLLGQIGAAMAFVATVGPVDRLWLPGLGMLEFGFWGYPLTILWLVGFMNTFNCLDGVHGLAGGGALVASSFLALIAYYSGAPMIFACCLLLFAATLGFFIFNFPGGKIFMGDTGSQFLGFVFAGLAVMGAAAEPERISFYVVPVLFYGFIFDFTVTVFVRFARGRDIMSAHREHLFQLCHRLGLSPLRICSIYLGLFLINGAAAMLTQWGAPWQRLYVVLLLLPVHIAYAAVVYRAAARHNLLDGG